MAFEKKPCEPEPVVEPGELAALLAPGGAVSRVLPGFEDRPEQVQMIEAVGKALTDEQVLLVEAGTGVGKSLAYALPAALWARRTGQRVVISTGTINLQEQLTGKDLPLVSRALKPILGSELNFVLVKGRANYLCQRRLAVRLRQRALVEIDELSGVFEALADWALSSVDGSRSDLDMAVPEGAWELVCSDADACLGRRCPSRDDCFFARARREAEQAELLVVNHHLLFADLALRSELAGRTRQTVLPAFSHLVLDEGHGVEDVAAGFFGLQLTRTGVLRSLGRLAPTGRCRPSGLLAELNVQTGVLASGGGPAGSGGPLAQQVGEARRAFDRAFDALVEFAEWREQAGNSSGERRLRLTAAVMAEPAWSMVHEAFAQAGWQTEKLAVELSGLIDRLEDLVEDEGRAAEGRAGVRRLLGMAEAARRLVDEELGDQVRWVELPGQAGGRFVKLAEAPLSVADRLVEALFEPLHSVVVTSATLSVGDSFNYLAERLGIDSLEPERVSRLQLNSPFDYPSQARLAVPSDAPIPTEGGFEDWLPEAVFQLVRASRGGALVLFTAWGLMTRSFVLVRDRLEELGFEPLCQGEAPRDRLLARFRDNPSSVLFGTDSFWQGVDVAGDALRLVVVTRLPFDVPTEPLIQARAERIEEAGKSSFAYFSLPRAVLRLKQGFGRLIRSIGDRGAVVVLDRRLTSKPYGRRFLASLPAATRVDGTLDAICDHLTEFFSDLRD